MNERSGQPVRSPDATGLGAPPGERYTLGAEIARGGMGRVVEATDTVLGRVVAFKEALSEDSEARRRFAREIRITARLEHPSIVPVHDAGTTPEGSPFYVMRKVSGRPLEDLVVAAETLAARLALVPHVLAAAQALAHAHERGVIHRDLKPSNILVGSLGESVVIDWGLAKVIDEPDDDEPVVAAPLSAGDSLRTRIGTVFGTPGFMSPEQLRGERVDAKSDVYALGATLYYVLARRPPHAANSGDDMMTAALAGPPQAIGELAPGVAPELVTIVDTALAYDDRRRYPSAAAFVADLQRFLTGQLVASHRYSRRARLKRFLEKHKLPVAIGALAMITIAVVATLAIRRVVTERNRADVALGDALDRNERLIATQAQTLLASNPTAAVATAKALGPGSWREARAIGMAARASGVARGYPASTHTDMIALTEDGNRAVTAGADGVVRLHDLVAHTTRELLRVEPEREVLLVDHDRRLVVWDAKHLELVELASGAHRAIKLPAPEISSVFAEGTQLWVAASGTVYTKQLDDPEFRRVPIDESIITIDASPDGSWVAYGGTTLWLQHGSDPPLAIATGTTTLLDWDEDGTRLAASVDMRSLEVKITDGIPKVIQDRPRRLALAIAAMHGGVYLGGQGEVTKTTAAYPEGFSVRVSEGSIMRMLHAYDNSLVAVAGFGKINVLGDQIMLTLEPPASELHVVMAAARSRFIVAATNGRLLVWDLPELLPELLPLERPIGYGVVGEHQIIAQFMDKPGEWHDLEKHDVVPVELGLLPLHVMPSDHDDLMAISTAAGAAIYRRGAPPIPIVAPLKFGFFTAGDALMVATETGDINIYEPPAYQPRTLFAHGAEALSLSLQDRGPPWVTALYADGTLWRYDLTKRTSTSVVTTITTPGWSFVAGDGDVYFSQGPLIKRWRADGAVEVQATLPREIRSVFLLDAAHVLVITDDAAGYDVRIDVPEVVTSRFSPGTRIRSVAVSSDIAITLDTSGTVLPTDPITGVTWSLGRSNRVPFTNVVLSRDGKRIFAIGGNGLLMWKQELPKTPEETRAFLDAMTNARAPNGAAALTWE